MVEPESTNQLLKDENQALQLALNSAETKLRTIQEENEVQNWAVLNLGWNKQYFAGGNLEILCAFLMLFMTLF
jgi:hypothetical protein